MNATLTREQTADLLDKWSDAVEKFVEGENQLFDMDYWGKLINTYDTFGKLLPESDCGTARCAGAIAAGIPEIKERGLVVLFARYGGNLELITDEPPKFDEDGDQIDDITGHDAIAAAFGIGLQEASHITSPLCYDHAPTRAEVAGRIRELAEQYRLPESPDA